MRAICSPDGSKRGYRRRTIVRLARYFECPDLRRLAESDLYWDRIVSVEPMGERDTYDLHVEEDHNFIANDLVVHNSHAASFALLAYASAYLKRHHPAAFYAALLNNQPMGFYHPATIVRDAQRHGQVIHPADVNFSGWLCVIEPDEAVRLGLRYVKGLREDMGKRIEEERRRRALRLGGRSGQAHGGAPRRADPARPGRRPREPRARAAGGALGGGARGPSSRELLYDELPDPPEPSPLRVMTPGEMLIADYEGTSLSLGPHPMEFHRARLDADARGAGVGSGDDAARDLGARGGRGGGAPAPGTAKGFVFLNLEDETGLMNVIVRPALFHRYRLALVNEPFLYVEGTLQHQDNVVSVRAERLAPLRHRPHAVPSHNFH